MLEFFLDNQVFLSLLLSHCLVQILSCCVDGHSTVVAKLTYFLLIFSAKAVGHYLVFFCHFQK